MKKRLSVLLGATLTIGFAASGSAAINSVGDPGRSWAQPDDAALGQHIQQFIDSAPFESPTYLVSEALDGDVTKDPTCESVSDTKCAGQNLRYQALIPYCVTETDQNCVAEIGSIDASGTKSLAKFDRYFPTKALNQFKGDLTRHVPDGGSGSIVSIPSALHDGGDKYYVSVFMNARVRAGQKAEKPTLEVRISPVGLEPSLYFTRTNDPHDTGYASILDRNTGVTRWGIQGAGFSGTQYCVANSASEKLCAQKYAFPADIRFFAKIRLSQLPVGWMHGRISAPDISITQESAGSSLEIQGNPVAVPAVYKMYNYPEMPAALKALYSVEKGGYLPSCDASRDTCAGGRSGPSKDPLNRNVLIAPAPYEADGMAQLKLWLPYVDDKATALPSFWSVRTLSQNEMQGASRCFADSSQITGIVTTNSTQYSAGPPAFDKSEGTLNYQVAAPHFGTTGDVFKGSYDLVMRSDVARCVYGFSKAPINATLSITSTDGTPQIATTVIGERNGWLYLQAKNFEFSAPVIKAKLTQAAAPAAKKVTITCVNGKTSKKVSAVNPKCPSGYRKK
ncbi:hypothetical protein MCEMRE203_01066 [Candidatus Nanopelagicaceae bacterium]